MYLEVLIILFEEMVCSTLPPPVVGYINNTELSRTGRLMQMNFRFITLLLCNMALRFPDKEKESNCCSPLHKADTFHSNLELVLG